MTGDRSDALTYDHFGNPKAKVSGGITTTIGWRFESELLSIDYFGTSNDDSYKYDGKSLRMRSKLAGATNWTNFVWDELTHELLAEYTLIAGTYTIKALNTHGLGLISSNREGTKRYFHFDGLGSTAALDDENENLKDSYTYEAFGVVQSATSTNGPSTNPFRFVGQWGYYDDGAMGSAGGLALLGVRYLTPLLGRFLSLDASLSGSRYSYTRNEPTSLIDPSGYTATRPKTCMDSFLEKVRGIKLNLKVQEDALQCIIECREKSFWEKQWGCITQCLIGIESQSFIDALHFLSCCNAHGGGWDPCHEGARHNWQKCGNVIFCQCMLKHPTPYHPDKLLAMAIDCEDYVREVLGSHYNRPGNRPF